MTRVPQRFKVPPLCLIAHLTATALAGPRGRFDPPFQRAAWAAVIERMACLSMPDERPEVQVHATSASPVNPLCRILPFSTPGPVALGHVAWTTQNACNQV